jgi:hypothetical protein
MAGFERYSALYSTVDGKLLTEATSISVVKHSGLNRVDTIVKGFAGMSQGSVSCDVTVENAVPSSDFELNPDVAMLEGKVVEIGFIMAGRQTVMKGFITEATYSHSVNDSGKLSFSAMCSFESFE